MHDTTHPPPGDAAPAELIGSWSGFERRTMTLSGRVRSEKVISKAARKVVVADYDLCKLPLLPPAMQQGIYALYRVRKTMPEEDSYTVAFYQDGRRPTCDCKWASFRHDDHPETVCVHVSLLLTIADFGAAINVRPPVVATPVATTPCEECGGAGEVLDPFGSGDVVPCHHCQLPPPY